LASCGILLHLVSFFPSAIFENSKLKLQRKNYAFLKNAKILIAKTGIPKKLEMGEKELL